jgi:hypothetical protein
VCGHGTAILYSPIRSHYLGFRVALGSHWGRIGVALGSLWGAYRLAINTLWGGFDVALMWLWATLARPSSFIIQPSAFIST